MDKDIKEFLHGKPDGPTPTSFSDLQPKERQDPFGVMTFGQAIEALKAGRKVARSGRNGKGMFLYLVPGSTFQVAEGRPLAAHLPVGETVNYHSHIDMKTATGEHVPWLASQTDMLAEDWQIV